MKQYYILLVLCIFFACKNEKAIINADKIIKNINTVMLEANMLQHVIVDISKPTDTDSLFISAVMILEDGNISLVTANFSSYLAWNKNSKKFGVPSLYELGSFNISLVEDKVITVRHAYEHLDVSQQIVNNDIATHNFEDFPFKIDNFKQEYYFTNAQVKDSVLVDIVGLYPSNNGSEVEKVVISGMAYSRNLIKEYQQFNITLSGPDEYIGNNDLIFRLPRMLELGGYSGAIVLKKGTNEVIGVYSGRELVEIPDNSLGIPFGRISQYISN